MKTRLQLLAIALLASVASLYAVQVNVTFYADGAEWGTAKVEAGSTHRISSLISSPTGCRGYDFVGWKEDGPVAGDETPTILTPTENISPEANINLYAVYRNTSAGNRYTRITSTADLHAGGQYLIVCYYEWDGDTYYGPSYFALGNTQSEGVNNIVYATGDTYRQGWTNYDVAATRYSISADQIHPDAGTIANPAEKNVWTLTGSEGTWRWTNEAANKSLYIRRGLGQKYYDKNGTITIINNQTYNEQILVNGNYTCSVTAANGAFNFEQGGYYLTYSDDEEDYFCMGTSNDWTFYLFKKESEYTSFPACTNWTVHLDALDGTIAGTSPAASTADVSETSSGSGVSLPTASISGAACSDWVFSGWHAESAIQGTTQAPTLCSNPYFPSYNGTTLYAVYQAGEEATYWERILNWDELQSGDICVIATKTGNYAVTAPYNNGYSRTTITVNGRRLRNTPEATVQWTFNGTYFVNGTTTLSYNGTSTTYYYKGSGNEPFVLEENQYSNYYLYNNGSKFVEQRNTSTEFYIYKKVVTHATYSSYPHCTPYSVTLNVAGGKFEDTGSRENRIVTETTAGSGVTLPNVEPLCPEDGWVFAGWQEGSDVGSVKDVNYTGLYTISYAPSRDGVTLYAVFKRPIDLFKIIHGPSEIVSGETYLITYYASDGGSEKYDFMLSSVASGSYLTGVKGEAPQDGEGYYMLASDSAVMWTVAGAGSTWNIKNLKNNQYLYLNTNGNTSTTIGVNDISITDRDGFAMHIANGYYRLNYSDGVFQTTYNTSTNYFCYLYRRANEYTSWPHCDPFTVNFDACGGTAGATSLTEEAAYAGITLPNAYANSDCSKEGWTFAGWATAPVSDESNILPLDVLPAGTTYNPDGENGTLYAVYQQKTNTYKRISSLSDLRLGLNYIIATSDNRAMSNTAQSTNYVASKAVTPASNIITSDDAAIVWRLQGARNAFELYNENASKFLDLHNAQKALLTENAEDNFFFGVSSGSFVVRSILAISDYKYLKYTSNYFTTDETSTGLYFYQQQAIYNSYPMCAEGVEALRWDKEGDNNYVYVESYVLSGAPNMTGAMGDAEAQADGTYKFLYNTTAAPAGSKKPITWAGTTARLNIPFVVSASANISTLGLPAKSQECDVVVLDGATLTIDANKEIHNLTIYEGATLNVANGCTLTVNSLILRCEDDQKMPTVNLNTSGSITLNNNEIYFDARIDEERYYWYSLPFNAQLQEISYSNLEANGKTPVYRTDYWVKYYNGALRAEDVNAGSLASTYWTHVAAKGSDYTLQAGQGYNVGIANQANTTQADGRKHTKRVLRFTLKAPSGWQAQEQNSNKVTTIASSSATDPKNAAHVGWNLVGNPYMHSYSAGTASGVVVGEWEKDEDDYYVIKEGATSTIPYFTVYDPSAEQGKRYSQVRTSAKTLRPFEAVFVQINSGTQISFTASSMAAHAPAYMRAADPDVPFYTGIELRSNDAIDRTGIVLNKDYTPAYEIGADLLKVSNEGVLNLYTINQYEQPLAFNGLSDDDAVAPIPVGVTFPAAGEYTFAFDFENYDLSGLEALDLIDKAQGTTTDLLMNDYTFVTNAIGTVNDRFQIIVRRAKDVATDIITPSLSEEGRGETTKFIYNGQLFIRRDGKIYNASGVQVK